MSAPEFLYKIALGFFVVVGFLAAFLGISVLGRAVHESLKKR